MDLKSGKYNENLKTFKDIIKIEMVAHVTVGCVRSDLN